VRRIPGEVKIGERFKMKYAIVVSGGKQFKAVEGSTIEVDRLTNEAGEQVSLDSVLLLVDGDQINVGKPTVAGAHVEVTVLEHTKGPKLEVFKYTPKKRIRVKTGHRQQYTLLKIESIVTE
jgi:large subunit ribosomal protein L21